jgi:TetR/AcrR family transcriptional regulator
LGAPSSREKILEAAEPLFAAGGYSGVGMQQIATTVGLSKSSLFHHFPTKLVLYGEVLDRVLERLERGLCDEVDHPGKAVEQLDHWIGSLIGTLAEDPPAARLMMRALVDEEPFPHFEPEPEGRELMPFETRLDRVIDRFRGLLEQGIADGVFRPVSIGDTIQTVIGAIVFHFASGDLGEALIGEPIFSGSAVERRRREVSEFIRRGLLA